MKGWSIAEAKARFSRVVADAVGEPQILYNRGKPVAAVVNYTTYQRMEEKLEVERKPSLRELLEEVRAIDNEADLEVPSRENRKLPEWS